MAAEEFLPHVKWGNIPKTEVFGDTDELLMRNGSNGLASMLVIRGLLANAIRYYSDISTLTGADSLASLPTLGLQAGRTAAFQKDGRLHVYVIQFSNAAQSLPEIVYPVDRGVSPNNRIWKFLGQMGSEAIDPLILSGGFIRSSDGNLIADGLWDTINAEKIVLVGDGQVDVDGDLEITGTAWVDNQPSNANDRRVANTAFVKAAITALIDSAPETLDTLNELAAALGDDPNFATTITNLIATKLPLAGGTMTGKISTRGSTGTVAFGDNTTAGIDVFSSTSADAAYINFRRTGAYGVKVGLDVDNKFKIGGFSMGGVSYEFWHEGNFNTTTLNGHVGSGGSSHALATTTVAGFMSAADKVKANQITFYVGNPMISEPDRGAVSALTPAGGTPAAYPPIQLSNSFGVHSMSWLDPESGEYSLSMSDGWRRQWTYAVGLNTDGYRSFASGLWDDNGGDYSLRVSGGLFELKDSSSDFKSVSLEGGWLGAWHSALNLGTYVDRNGDEMVGQLTTKGSVGGINTTDGNNSTIQVMGSGGSSAAYMSFHRPGVFAAHIGLSELNRWSVGGWSMGNVTYDLYHQGVFPSLSHQHSVPQFRSDLSYVSSGFSNSLNFVPTAGIPSGTRIRLFSNTGWNQTGEHTYELMTLPFYDGQNKPPMRVKPNDWGSGNAYRMWVRVGGVGVPNATYTNGASWGTMLNQRVGVYYVAQWGDNSTGVVNDPSRPFSPNDGFTAEPGSTIFGLGGVTATVYGYSYGQYTIAGSFDNLTFVINDPVWDSLDITGSGQNVTIMIAAGSSYSSSSGLAKIKGLQLTGHSQIGCAVEFHHCSKDGGYVTAQHYVWSGSSGGSGSGSGSEETYSYDIVLHQCTFESSVFLGASLTTYTSTMLGCGWSGIPFQQYNSYVDNI